MTSERPVILLVHGAFQQPVHYESVLGPLREKGFTVVAPQLPTTGTDPQVDYTDDVEVINRALEPLLEAGKEVVIIAHSFGTLSASHCIEGESVAERKECGMAGGIKSYINVCGFAYPERGRNIIGKHDGFPMQEYYHAVDGLIHLRDGAKPVFYNDFTPEQAEDMWTSIIKTHSEKNFNSLPKFVDKDITIPKTYVLCENDVALAVEYQAYFIGNGGYEDVVRLPSGHFPFLTMPDRMVQIVCEVSERPLSDSYQSTAELAISR